MHIDEFKLENTDEVIDLWSRCGLLAPQNDPKKDIERKMKVDPDLFLVLKEEGKIIGSVMGGYEGHRGWINYLAVDPKSRRCGVARKLMTEVEQRLIKKGCPKINLQVRESNLEVLAFYDKIGYSTDKVVSLGKRLRS
ncbi:MAG: GNAT family acetyltransferase [Sulfurospirillaceae bacterium]|nr:GNAT family acetyltransferase [Sulfurospirillaceae bacterium]